MYYSKIYKIDRYRYSYGPISNIQVFISSKAKEKRSVVNLGEKK